MDVLAGLLARAHARGSVFSSLALRKPWRAALSGRRPLTLHAILRRDAHLQAGGPSALPLAAGDLVLAQAGDPYAIVDAPGAVATPIAHLRSTAPGGAARDPANAELLCGA